jgi:hypothetical protein
MKNNIQKNGVAYLMKASVFIPLLIFFVESVTT